MAPENGSKNPTWKWIANSALAILFVFLTASVADIRNDIKEGSKTTAEIANRMTKLETTGQMQLEVTREFREDIRDHLGRISGQQDRTTNLLNKSSVTLKEWKKAK